MTTGKEMWLTEDVVRLIAQAYDMDEMEVVDEEDDVHPPPPPTSPPRPPCRPLPHKINPFFITETIRSGTGVSKLTETKPEDTDCSTNFTKIV